MRCYTLQSQYSGLSVRWWCDSAPVVALTLFLQSGHGSEYAVKKYKTPRTPSILLENARLHSGYEGQVIESQCLELDWKYSGGEWPREEKELGGYERQAGQ